MSGVTRPAAYFSLSLPVVFWLLASSLAQRPTEACLPFRARLGKNVEEISAAPEHLFPGAGPDAGGARRGGAVAHNPEDSNQKTRKRFSKSRGGHGGACDSRDHPQQSDAQRTPISGLRASEYQASWNLDATTDLHPAPGHKERAGQWPTLSVFPSHRKSI